MSYFSGHAISRKLGQLYRNPPAKIFGGAVSGLVMGFYSAAFWKTAKLTINAFAQADLMCYDVNRCSVLIPHISNSALQAAAPQGTCSKALLDLAIQCCILAAVGNQTIDIYRTTRAVWDQVKRRNQGDQTDPEPD